MDILESLLGVAPAAWRKPIKFAGFCVVIVAATLYCRSWVEGKADERLNNRILPIELQIVQLEAVLEAAFEGEEALRVKADPGAHARSVRDIKRQALKDALERRQLEQIPLQFASPTQ